MELISMFLIYFAAVFLHAGECEAATLVKEDPKGVEEKTMYVKKFEMEGHTYIYFLEPGEVSLKQILHDPNCECQKIKKEEKK